MRKNTVDCSKRITSLNKRFVKIIVVIFLLFSYSVISIYFLAFRDTSANYSFTQTYKTYYSLEDWNLSKHAFLDLDEDGKQDMITFTNCAFLSSVSEDFISQNKKCTEPEMSPIGFSNSEVMIGQKLESIKPFRYQSLRKSFLVKTKNDVWKYYDNNGLHVRTYELGDNHIFIEKQPTLLDVFDAYIYQASHFGVMIFLFLMQQFMR